MATLRDIFRDPLWVVVGLFITILSFPFSTFLARQQRRWLVICGLLTTFFLGLFIGALLDDQHETGYSLSVSASSPHPFLKTAVTINKGDDVEIIVQGNDASWSCGLDPVSPYGHINDKKPEEVFPAANVCELIGYIGEGPFFRVGAYARFTAIDSGSLYLGANDAKDCSIAKNCYSDNQGTIAVKITVRSR